MDKLEVAKQAAMGLTSGMDPRLVLGGIKSMFPDMNSQDLLELVMSGLTAYSIDVASDEIYRVMKDGMSETLNETYKDMTERLRILVKAAGGSTHDIVRILGAATTPNVILGQALISAGERILKNE